MKLFTQVKLPQMSFSLAQFSIGTYQGLVPDIPPFNTKTHMPKCLMQDGAIALWVLHIHGSSICGCEMPTVCLITVHSYLLLLLRGFLKSGICLKLGGLIFFSFLPLFSLIFLKSVSLMCLSTDIVCRYFSSSSLQLYLSYTVFSGLDNTCLFLVPSQCLTLKKGCTGEIVWNCFGIVWNCFHDDGKTYFELDTGFEGLNPTYQKVHIFLDYLTHYFM